MPETMPTADDLAHLLRRLAGEDITCTDEERVDLLSVLESVKSACAAAQARLTVAFESSQRRQQASRGLPAAKQGVGVAAQVALARRESPAKGGRLLGLAKALVREMPHTLAALSSGEISEWRATIMVRETATLSATDRAIVDAELAGRLRNFGDRGVEREARKLAYHLDPGSALRRMRGARSDRRVTVRPAPDTMSYLTGFLPAEQGIAVHTALSRHADALQSSGDRRTRGQIMADTLVERVTGQGQAPAVPVEIQLVITDRSLWGGDDSPARLTGHGPIPAALGRAIVRASAEGTAPAKAWVRRVFTSPHTGQLVAMDSRRRFFPAALRTLLVVRDEVCRTPWCDAPIRHADHVVPVTDGGETSAANGQGLCAACNQTKEAPGWSSRPDPDLPSGRRAYSTVTVTTPTGHRHRTRAPAPPGRRVGLGALQHLAGPRRESCMEQRLAAASDRGSE